MPDDHSELEPPLPIPNRTVKRYRADDSAATSVKVGYRQAIISKKPLSISLRGFFLFILPFQHSPYLPFPVNSWYLARYRNRLLIRKIWFDGK